jgi:phenylalanyl-tRNA synthetase beta subunit
MVTLGFLAGAPVCWRRRDQPAGPVSSSWNGKRAVNLDRRQWATSLTRFPAIERDQAVVVPAGSSPRQHLLSGGRRGEAQGLHPFDVYQGFPVPAGNRSLAYPGLPAAGPHLTDAEVNAAQERVTGRLQDRLGATLRSTKSGPGNRGR